VIPYLGFVNDLKLYKNDAINPKYGVTAKKCADDTHIAVFENIWR
jgi:hypothetical protein